MVLIEELEKCGCRVEFVERPMSSEPNDQLLLQIRGAVAEYERTLVKERMRRGKLAKLKAGLLLPWTRCPYGYRTDPDKPRDPDGVRLDEEKAAVVAEIFAMYLEEGETLCGVANKLRDQGVRTGEGENCPSRYAPAEQLDEVVWQDLCEILTHPESITDALRRAHGGQWLPQELKARQENLREGRAALERQLERLMEAYLGEIIPLAEYRRRRQELEQKDEALKGQQRRLRAQADQRMELAGVADSIEDFCVRVQGVLAGATFERRRQLVELLIDRVIVTDDEVEIRYVIPTDPSGEHNRFCHLRTDYSAHPQTV